MHRSVLLAFALFGFIEMGLAQDIPLLQTRELGSFRKNSTSHVLAEKDGFIYTMGTNAKSPIIVYDFDLLYLRKYRAADLSLENEWVIENSEFKAEQVRLKDFFIKDEHLFIFIDVFDKQKKVRELFVRQVSFEGQQRDFKKLISVPSTYIGSRKFFIEFSPDQSRILVYADISASFKQPETPKIFVFDNSMSLIYERTPKVKGVSQDFVKPTDIKVNNLGETFILTYAGSKRDMKNDGFITTNYQISRYFKEDEVVSYSLNDLDLKIHGAGIGVDKLDRLVLNALSSSPGSEKVEGNLSVVLDNKTLERIDIDKNRLRPEVIETLHSLGYGPKSSVSFNLYDYSDFIQLPDGMVFIVEQFYHTGINLNNLDQTFQRSILIIRLDTNGFLDEVSIIERNQSRREYYDKYFLATKGDELYLMFYDNVDNVERRKTGLPMEGAFKLGEKSFSVTMAKIPSKGDITFVTAVSQWIFGQRPFMLLDRSVLGENGRIYSYIFNGWSKIYLAEIDPSM